MAGLLGEVTSVGQGQALLEDSTEEGLEADHALHADEDRARDLLVEGAGLGTGDREAEGTKNLGDQGLTLEEEDQDLNRLKGEGLMKNPSQRAVQDLSQSLNPGRSLHLNQGQDQEPGRGPDQVKDNEAVNLLVIYNGK